MTLGSASARSARHASTRTPHTDAGREHRTEEMRARHASEKPTGNKASGMSNSNAMDDTYQTATD